MGTAGTVGARAEALDAARFVGRAAERAWVADARRSPDAPRVLHVSGAGGIGKSALLRAVARDAVADGHPVAHVDGRLIGAAVDEVGAALRSATGAPGAVVIVDEADAVAGLHLVLRDLVAGLPDDVVVVIAGRRAPGREWYEDALEHVVDHRRLDPLGDDDARELVARHGAPVDDPAALVEWAGGHPLALTLGTRAGGPPRANGERAELGDRLVAHLAATELDAVDPAVLELAAHARALDDRMAAAVLPGRATREAVRRLRASSVTEPVGPRLALHDLVRRAILARPAPDGVDRSELVVRLADHLAARAADDPGLVVDLAELVGDGALRAVMLGSSRTHVADRARADDGPAARRLWASDGDAWADRLARWCAEASAHVTAVRRLDGGLAGIGVAGPLDAVPTWGADLVELGPVRDHACARGVADDALFLHDMHLVGEEGSAAFEEARKVIIGAVAIRHGVTRRHMYFTSDAPMPADCEEAFGYREVTELRRDDGTRTLRTWTTDMGPDGVVGQLRTIVRAEQGRPATAPATAHGAQVVIDALRSFHDDDVLARSPLAAGAGPEAARRAVVAMLDRAFGPGPTDVALRATLEHTYIDPDGGPVRAMARLHMSRSSLYRHLQRARAQLGAAIGEDLARPQPLVAVPAPDASGIENVNMRSGSMRA